MLSFVRPNTGPFVALVAMCCCFATCARAQTTTPSPEPQAVTPPPSNSNVSALSLEAALQLANAVASNYQIAILNEKVAAEDIKQAQAAFLPGLTNTAANFTYSFKGTLSNCQSNVSGAPTAVARGLVALCSGTRRPDRATAGKAAPRS